MAVANDFLHYLGGPVALKMPVSVGIGMERKWSRCFLTGQRYSESADRVAND